MHKNVFERTLNLLEGRGGFFSWLLLQGSRVRPLWSPESESLVSPQEQCGNWKLPGRCLVLVLCWLLSVGNILMQWEWIEEIASFSKMLLYRLNMNTSLFLYAVKMLWFCFLKVSCTFFLMLYLYHLKDWQLNLKILLGSVSQKHAYSAILYVWAFWN